jgi:hypothetical protein
MPIQQTCCCILKTWASPANNNGVDNARSHRRGRWSGRTFSRYQGRSLWLLRPDAEERKQQMRAFVDDLKQGAGLARKSYGK